MATPLAEQASQELFDLARQIPELKAHLKESGIIFDDQGWRIHGTNVMNNNGMLCIKGAVAEYLAKLGGFIADFKHEGNWRFLASLSASMMNLRISPCPMRETRKRAELRI